MSGEEKFLSRWSRLKRKNIGKQAPVSAPSPPGDAPDTNGQRSSSTLAEEPCEPFDLASLPSIESIAAHTDVTGFLRRGVPPEFTKAALRRAWVADPAIRDFVGIAENQWDFTKADTIHGFGPLEVTDDVADLVARALGKSESHGQAATPGKTEPKPMQPCAQAGAPATEFRQPEIEHPAPASDPHSPGPLVGQPIAARARRHGKALPE